MADPDIRLFDAKGLHLQTFGRRGGGPGEYQRPRRVWPLADSLIVWDWLTNRITFVPRAGGDPRGITPTVPSPGRSYNQEAWLLGDRLVLPLQDLVRNEPGAMEDIFIRFAAVSLHDGTLDTLVSVPAGEHGWLRLSVQGREAVTYGAPLFQGMTHATVAGGRLMAGSSLRPAISQYASDGRQEREIQWNAQGFPVTAELRSIFREERSNGSDDPVGMRASIDALPAADTFPHFAGLIGDDLGRLWVRMYDLPGVDATSRWIVHDTAGARVAVVEAPDGLNIYAIRDDRVLAMRSDSLGVQRVVVLPIHPVDR